MLRKTMIRAALGLVIGMVVGNVIALLFSGFTALASPMLIAKTGSPFLAAVVQTLASGLYGAIAMAGVGFYDVEEWSLLKAVLVHYATVMLPYIPLGLLLGWIRPEAFASDYGIVFAAQTATYAVIFLIMYFRYRAEVKELNEMLQNRKNK